MMQMRQRALALSAASATAGRRLSERGVTYLAVMLAVVLIGISLTTVGKSWKVSIKRDREAELLFRGNRIKAAIEQFAANYEVMKSVRDHRFPMTLEEMTKPPKPTLQMVYKDPITGGDFELVRVNGEIQGVRSRSRDKPLDQVNFKDAKTYSDLLFKAEIATGQPCAPGLNQLNPLAASSGPLPGSQPSLGGMPAADGMPGGGVSSLGGQPGQAPQSGCSSAPGSPGQAPAQPGLAGAPTVPTMGAGPAPSGGSLF
ncbi:hypothetical protein [Nitrospira sp. Kam-Ns4a]